MSYTNIEMKKASTRIPVLKKKPKVNKLIIYFVLVTFFFISVMPIFWIVLASIKGSTGANPFAFPSSLTIENIVKAWTVGNMGQYFINSIIVAVPRVVGVLILATLAGYAFGKLHFPGKNLLFFFFLFGMMVPIQAIIIPLYYTIASFNMINTYWALFIPNFGLSMPFAIFMMRAFFKDLPNELMDSAKMDGCNQFQTLLYVLLPLMIPAITSLIVFEFVWSWNDFLLPLLFVYDHAHRTLPLGLMYFQGQYASNQSLIGAGVAISTIPMLIVYIIFQRKFIEGMTSGSVKG